jgi:hypothetical protein
MSHIYAAEDIKHNQLNELLTVVPALLFAENEAAFWYISIQKLT